MMKTVAKVTYKGTWRVIHDTEKGVYMLKAEVYTPGEYGLRKHSYTTGKFQTLPDALRLLADALN